MRERDLIQAAWREYQGARAIEGILDGIHDSPRPPRWFVDRELGFSVSEGPSLMWTCLSLARANAAAVKQLGTEAPYKVTWPRARKSALPAVARPQEQIGETLAQILARY